MALNKIDITLLILQFEGWNAESKKMKINRTGFKVTNRLT